jgi:aspartyl protease family protein
VHKLLLLAIVLGTALGLILPSNPRGDQSTAAPHHRFEAAAATNKAADPSGEAQPASGSPTRIERQGNGHFYVDAEVNGGELVHFLVDTGASSVALTMEDAKRLGVGFSPSEFTVIGTGASGEVRGQMVTLSRVSVQGREVRDVNGAIIEGLTTSLLGQSYLSRIGSIEMSGDYLTLR